MAENVQKEFPQSVERKKDFGFFYDVVKLISGNGFAQAVKVLLSPVISRLFLPEFFGITQNFSSIANILAVISSMRYDQSIMLPKAEKKAAVQLNISVLFLLVTTPIFTFLIWLLREEIARLLNSPDLSPYLMLVPIQVIAISLFNIFNQWNSRKRKYFRFSISKVVNEVTADGMTAGFGFAGLAGGSTMIISRISGQLLSAISLGLLVIKEDGKLFFDSLRWQEIKAGIKEYRKFPQFNIWSSLLSTLSLYFPGIILSAYFSPTIAGYFSIWQNVLRMPIALIGNSIGQVFFQRGAKTYHEGRFAATVEETMKRLIIFGLFPMLVVMVIGKELFTTAFGSEWTQAGVYSQILSIWTLLVFIVQPLNKITSIIEKNEMSVVLNIAKIVTGAASLIIGGMADNILLGLWLFSITGVLSYGIFILWATSAAGVPSKKILKYFAGNLLICAPFLALIFLFQQFNPLHEIYLTRFQLFLPSLGLIFFSVVIGIIYYLIVILRDESIKEAVQMILKKYKGMKKSG